MQLLPPSIISHSPTSSSICCDGLLCAALGISPLKSNQRPLSDIYFEASSFSAWLSCETRSTSMADKEKTSKFVCFFFSWCKNKWQASFGPRRTEAKRFPHSQIGPNKNFNLMLVFVQLFQRFYARYRSSVFSYPVNRCFTELNYKR